METVEIWPHQKVMFDADHLPLFDYFVKLVLLCRSSPFSLEKQTMQLSNYPREQNVVTLRNQLCIYGNISLASFVLCLSMLLGGNTNYYFYFYYVQGLHTLQIILKLETSVWSLTRLYHISHWYSTQKPYMLILLDYWTYVGPMATQSSLVELCSQCKRKVPRLLQITRLCWIYLQVT